MSTMFKSFLSNDIAQTRTLLNEAIPITGALLSGTYGTFPNESNIRNFSHGMWTSIYDYPYLSSSANYLMDITVGYANSSGLSSSTNIQNDKKINMYGQMAQTLMGFDHTGSVQLFDQDGNILAGGDKIKEAVFINFARLLTKDEIKKGSFSMRIGTGSFDLANNKLITINDAHAPNDYKVNSPAGEYAVLTCSSWDAEGKPHATPGLIFYQAGIVVLTASVFTDKPSGLSNWDVPLHSPGFQIVGGNTITASLTGAYISSSADAIRHRIYDISFSNTTELNSTIYFCRLDSGDFNYSSNPSYLSGSRIVVKQNSMDMPVSYITTIGMYSPDNELLAVAKLSEPLKKAPDTSLTLRVRLDY
ncbi:MAG: hypothetical protein Q8P81_02270 [Nanoarchaeota archaeon]|nr:hypothetical protein [Nanoarchaeota archaeon]